MDNILNNIADKENYEILVSLDIDDATMYNKETLTRLKLYIDNKKVTVVFGYSKSKVDAINRDVEKIKEWDILINFSDDMSFEINGFDSIVRDKFKEYFPDTNGNIYFNNGFRGDISTLSIIGRVYYDDFGYIYDLTYLSLCCDEEYTIVATQSGKMKYFPDVICRHNHPAWTGEAYDEQLIKNESLHQVDANNFHYRKLAGFPKTLLVESVKSSEEIILSKTELPKQKTNLYLNYYEDKNEVRNSELITCFTNNLSNKNIDNIYVFVNNEDGQKLYNRYLVTGRYHELNIIFSETRPTYRDYFNEINKNTSDIDVNIISNTDIYFDESIKYAGLLTPNNCYALSRWDVKPDGHTALHFNHADSQDCWIFKGKVKDVPDCDFTMGLAGCDNAIAERLNRSGYSVENVSGTIKAYHLHISGINNYNPEVKVPQPYLMVHSTIIPDDVIQRYNIELEERKVSEQISEPSFIDSSKPLLKILNASLMVEEDNGFVRAMKKVATGGYMQINPSSNNFNSTVISMAESFLPDIIFCQVQQEGLISGETAKRLSEIGFCINWNGDVRNDVPSWMIDVGRYFQLTSFSNMVDVKKIKGFGINSDYLEIGIDPERFNKHGVTHHCENIVAFFNDYGSGFFPLSQYRLDIVGSLKNTFGHQFGVYGNFSNANGNFNDNQVRESQQYNNCKIAISCSHYNYERYSSDRLLRAMASGAFVLSHHYDGVEEDFVVGEHLDTFKDLSELTAKCYYYLEHVEEREKIAAAGYKHVRSRFTFDNMAEEIVKLYYKHKK